MAQNHNVIAAAWVGVLNYALERYREVRHKEVIRCKKDDHIIHGKLKLT
jgi:hypothetical protein